MAQSRGSPATPVRNGDSFEFPYYVRHGAVIKWVSSSISNIPYSLLAGRQIQQMRPSSYVDVQEVQGAGHHVYADRPQQVWNRTIEIWSNECRVVCLNTWTLVRNRWKPWSVDLISGRFNQTTVTGTMYCSSLSRSSTAPWIKLANSSTRIWTPTSTTPIAAIRRRKTPKLSVPAETPNEELLKLLY